MAGIADEWVSALMLTVAVCERIELLADESESPSSVALTTCSLTLRKLATGELNRLREFNPDG
jgi:hypothetical protein